MRAEPTDKEHKLYEENGFVVIEEFLDAHELAIWRREVDDAVQARGARRFPHDSDDADRIASHVISPEEQAYYDRVFTQRLNLWQTHEGVRELMFTPELGSFGGRVAGVDGLRIWHDQALIKGRYANPTAYHLDVPYWSFTSADAITIWVALDDATLENGCLYYVPGSHKARKFDNVGIGREIGPCSTSIPSGTMWRRYHARSPPEGRFFITGWCSTERERT